MNWGPKPNRWMQVTPQEFEYILQNPNLNWLRTGWSGYSIYYLKHNKMEFGCWDGATQSYWVHPDFKDK